MSGNKKLPVYFQYVHYEIDPADLTTDEAKEAAGAYKRGQIRPEGPGEKRAKSKDISLAVRSLDPAVQLYPAQVNRSSCI